LSLCKYACIIIHACRPLPAWSLGSLSIYKKNRERIVEIAWVSGPTDPLFGIRVCLVNTSLYLFFFTFFILISNQTCFLKYQKISKKFGDPFEFICGSLAYFLMTSLSIEL
jgi:hypothetical protein